MASDSKKVQTIVNVCAEQATIIRQAIATMVTMRNIFTTVNPNTAGTPLAGGAAAALNTALNALNTEMNTSPRAATWTALIAARVPTHTNNALD